jgi:hypothetical protein
MQAGLVKTGAHGTNSSDGQARASQDVQELCAASILGENKALYSIEQIGAGAAFKRCQELADQISAELRAKKPGRLNTRALDEFQIAIERAARSNSETRIGGPNFSLAC